MFGLGSEQHDDDEKEDKKDNDVVLKAASVVQPASAPAPKLLGVPKGIDLDGEIIVYCTETATSSGGSKNPFDKVSSAIEAINARLSNLARLFNCAQAY
ncbi:pre-mRNA processing RNA-helicase [Clarireedia jacksonii]